MLRIFIGRDSRFPEPADVLRYSLLADASVPLDIRSLKLISSTNGGPWFDAYRDHAHAAVWFEARDAMLAAPRRQAA